MDTWNRLLSRSQQKGHFVLRLCAGFFHDRSLFTRAMVFKYQHQQFCFSTVLHPNQKNQSRANRFDRLSHQSSFHCFDFSPVYQCAAFLPGWSLEMFCESHRAVKGGCLWLLLVYLSILSFRPRTYGTRGQVTVPIARAVGCCRAFFFKPFLVATQMNLYTCGAEGEALRIQTPVSIGGSGGSFLMEQTDMPPEKKTFDGTFFQSSQCLL